MEDTAQHGIAEGMDEGKSVVVERKFVHMSEVADAC